MLLSPFHAFQTACELSHYRGSADRLCAAYASSDIEIFPYQIAAALFALRSPYLKGSVLADEGSLGKTYEAMLVISEMWFEGREKIIIIVPTPLLGQWVDIMNNCFTVPFTVIDSNESFTETDEDNPFEQESIVLTTYDFAVSKAEYISRINWNMAVFEEAHRLNNKDSKTAITLRNAVGGAYKLLLTATPMQNSIMDLYSLIHFIDYTVLGDSDEFYKRYFRKPENYYELTSRVSRYVFRTLRSQVGGYVKIPHRLPVTVDYKPCKDELRLSALLAEYLNKPKKTAFPKMDLWELSLMLWRSLSSSTFAFAKLLKSAVEREPEPELVEMLKLEFGGLRVESGKGVALLKALKIGFSELKKKGSEQKVLIFTEYTATQEYLFQLLEREYPGSVLIYNGKNSRNYSIIEQFHSPLSKFHILISTDVAAEGFNLAFCSFIVNYDLPYNVLTLEQRIMRCHRQGQQSDVVVLNFLSKNSLSDTRMLELINKRVLQFDGIVGMSDEIVGEISDNAVSGIVSAFSKARHKKDIEAEYQAILAENESDNITAVSEAENVLFTTFTRNIAKKVTVTPQYIKDRTPMINAKLWALTKWFFNGKDGYKCVDETRTLKIGVQPQKVFTGAHLGRREYSIDDKTLPKSGRLTICGTLAKNMLNEIFWRGITDGGSVVVERVESGERSFLPCEVGYYQVRVMPKDVYWGGNYYNVFVGKTKDGRVLDDAECRAIMDLPVIRFSADTETYGNRDGISKPKPMHELDDMINADEYIMRAFADTDEERLDEIESIKLRAVHQKNVLEQSLSELRLKIKSVKNELSAQSGDRLKELTINKQLKMLEKELRGKEQNLFFDQMRVDADAEEEVKALTERADLKVEIRRQFAINICGGNIE